MKTAISKKTLWESIPAPLRRVSGALLQHIPLPLLFGRRFRQIYSFLNESQWWPHERIREYQRKQLSEFLQFAYHNSRFYRRLFDEHRIDTRDPDSFRVLASIPFSTKEIIAENVDVIITAPKTRLNIDYVTTGGTSGTTLRFYAPSERSQTEYAYLLSNWGRVGFTAGSPMAVLRGRTVAPDKNGLYHTFDPLLRHHYYSSFHMTDKNINRYVEHINSIGPCYLHVYPSSATQMAKHMKRNGIAPLSNVRAVLAESENLYDWQRQLLNEQFAVRIFSSYGHTEKLVAAAECEYSNDYHVWPHYGHFELIDKNGNPISTPGRIGEIIGTGYINRITPFIRYRTGDFATFVADSCPLCKRNHILLRAISGHNIQEYLVANDLSLIPWSAINMHDDTFDDVQHFQFFQDTPGQVRVKIQPASTFSPPNIQRIRDNISKKLAGRITVDVDVVNAIPLTKSGKSIFVDQKIPDFEKLVN